MNDQIKSTDPKLIALANRARTAFDTFEELRGYL